VVLEALILTLYFVSSRNENEHHDISSKRTVSDETTSDDYYIHDAVVASVHLNPLLVLSEMITAISCAVEEEPDQVRKDFEDAIPHIIDKVIAKFEVDRGRIVEKTDEELEVSDNYKARIRGATLSCIDVLGWSDDLASPAIYASHLVASTLDIPTRVGPDAYNVSVMFEGKSYEEATRVSASCTCQSHSLCFLKSLLILQ